MEDNYQETINLLSVEDPIMLKTIKKNLSSYLENLAEHLLKDDLTFPAFTVLGFLYRNDSIDIPSQYNDKLLSIFSKQLKNPTMSSPSGFLCLTVWFIGIQKKIKPNDIITNILVTALSSTSRETVIESLQTLLQIQKYFPTEILGYVNDWITLVLKTLSNPQCSHLAVQILESPFLKTFEVTCPSLISKGFQSCYQTIVSNANDALKQYKIDQNVAPIILNIKIFAFTMIYGGKYIHETELSQVRSDQSPETKSNKFQVLMTWYQELFELDSEEIHFEALKCWKYAVWTLILYSPQFETSMFKNQGLIDALAWGQSRKKSDRIRAIVYETHMIYIKCFFDKFKKGDMLGMIIDAFCQQLSCELSPEIVRKCFDFLIEMMTWNPVLLPITKIIELNLKSHKKDEIIRFFKAAAPYFYGSQEHMTILSDCVIKLYQTMPKRDWKKSDWVLFLSQMTMPLFGSTQVSKQVLAGKWSAIPKEYFVDNPNFFYQILFELSSQVPLDFAKNLTDVAVWKMILKRKEPQNSEVIHTLLLLPIKFGCHDQEVSKIWKDTCDAYPLIFNEIAQNLCNTLNNSTLEQVAVFFHCMCESFAKNEPTKFSNLIKLAIRIDEMGKNIDVGMIILLNSITKQPQKIGSIFANCFGILRKSLVVWKVFLETMEKAGVLNEDWFREYDEKMCSALASETVGTMTREFLSRFFRFLPEKTRTLVKKRKMDESSKVVEPSPKKKNEKVYPLLIGCKDTLRHSLLEFPTIGDLADKCVGDLPDKINIDDLREWIEREYAFSIHFAKTFEIKDKLSKISKEELWELSEKCITIQQCITKALKK